MRPIGTPRSTRSSAAPAPATPRWRRFAAAVATVSLAAAGSLVLAVVADAPAGAASGPTAHDPIGAVTRVVAVTGGLKVTGWAADPDALTDNARIAAVLDGTSVLATATTSFAWASVTSKYHTGPTPRYTFTVPVPSGKHTVCVVITNSGAGMRTVSKCIVTPLGRTLTSSQQAAHNPVGKVSSAWANAKSIHVRGWASDPDLVTRRSLVVLYVDGQPVATRATGAYPGARPAQAGPSSKFDILVPSSIGTHIGCVWVVNVGIGTNTFLGCTAVDNRSPGNAVPAATAAPAANAQILALAKKQIGRPYVWAAAGPRSFDCSGLVIWSYGKYGISTPRVSQDQIKAARLIPQSHARPGDLVFYHDNVGDVYHVGIYIKPGLSVAAIDTDRGVDYQNIWDTTATYGSFTHT